jgi:hypothetical protein
MGRAVVPPDFRARLEAARLDTLALLRALDPREAYNDIPGRDPQNSKRNGHTFFAFHSHGVVASDGG